MWPQKGSEKKNAFTQDTDNTPHDRPYEYKGTTDELAGEDLLTLLIYGLQYMRLAKVSDTAKICLMVVCDRITRSFLDQAKPLALVARRTRRRLGLAAHKTHRDL